MFLCHFHCGYRTHGLYPVSVLSCLLSRGTALSHSLRTAVGRFCQAVPNDEWPGRMNNESTIRTYWILCCTWFEAKLLNGSNCCCFFLRDLLYKRYPVLWVFERTPLRYFSLLITWHGKASERVQFFYSMIYIICFLIVFSFFKIHKAFILLPLKDFIYRQAKPERLRRIGTIWSF